MKIPSYVMALTCIMSIPTTGNKVELEEKTSNTTSNLLQEVTTNRYIVLDPPQFSNDSTKVILFFFMAFVAMVSIVSNSLVIHAVRVNQHMRSSTTNYLIVNMAVGDLLGTIFIASTTMKVVHSGFHWSSGIIGEVSCKGPLFVATTGLLCSVFSLVAITFDRFMAVTRPIAYKYCSLWTKYIIPAVWIAALATASRLVFVKLEIRNDFLPNNKTYCFFKDAADEGITTIALGVFGPQAAMVVMYSMIAYKLWTRRVPGDVHDAAQRQNVAQNTAKKVTRMVICVVLVFDICMAPAFTVFFMPFVFDSASWMYNKYSSSLFSLCSNSNGFFNVLVYAFFNENYRRAFSDALGLQRIRHWLRKKTERKRKFFGKRKATAKFTVAQSN